MPTEKPGVFLFRPVRAGNAFEETVERLLQSISWASSAPATGCPRT